jgi:hypothetical protein
MVFSTAKSGCMRAPNRLPGPWSVGPDGSVYRRSRENGQCRLARPPEYPAAAPTVSAKTAALKILKNSQKVPIP